MRIWPKDNGIGRVVFLKFGLLPLVAVFIVRDETFLSWISHTSLLEGLSYGWILITQGLVIILLAAWFLLIAAKRLRDLRLPDYLGILMIFISSQIAGGFQPPLSTAILLVLQGGSLLALILLRGASSDLRAVDEEPAAGSV